MKKILLVLCIVLAIVSIALAFNFNDYLTEKRERELSETQKIELLAHEKKEMKKTHEACELSKVDNKKYLIFVLVILSLCLIIGLVKLALGMQEYYMIAIAIIGFILIMGMHIHEKNKCENAAIYLQSN